MRRGHRPIPAKLYRNPLIAAVCAPLIPAMGTKAPPHPVLGPIPFAFANMPRRFVHENVTNRDMTLALSPCRMAKKGMPMFGIDVIDASLLPAMLIALVAGVISFLSPCVLPIVPPYLAYMAGTSMEDVESGKNRKVIIAALFFVMGLSTIFMLMGIAASTLGRAILQYQGAMTITGGIIVMFFGLHFLDIIRIPFLYREARIDAGDRGGSIIGAYILGVAFAFGWTPCIGPILGTILFLVVEEGSISKGMFMMMAYAFGLGIPFLLAAIFIRRSMVLMNRFKKHMHRIERISGLLLWTIGLMMLTGSFTDLAYWLQEKFPGLAAIG